MCSLTERINTLEGMLRENGAEPPLAQHPPMTRHGIRQDDPSPSRRYNSKSQIRQNIGATNGVSSDNTHSSPGSQNDDMVFEREGSSSHRGDDGDSAQSASSPSMIPPPKKDGIVSRLLSTRGHLSFDQLSGRLRYFGPSTNCHVHSEFGVGGMDTKESFEQTRRAEKIIRQLPMETYEYLMSLFWQHYNSYMHVIHQEAFHEDRENGRTQFYSPFLHICVLAVGFRFADRSRLDMQRITVAPRESSLHREAKYMLEFELERPSGITMVVALLIMSDLECGVGRDNLGWLYSGMAVR
jgi:Fungal specific transcription factor domain